MKGISEETAVSAEVTRYKKLFFSDTSLPLNKKMVAIANAMVAPIKTYSAVGSAVDRKYLPCGSKCDEKAIAPIIANSNITAADAALQTVTTCFAPNRALLLGFI